MQTSPVRTKHEQTVPLAHSPAGAPIAFIVVFLNNYNNFGHVCIPIKRSALIRYHYIVSVYRVVSTVAHHMYS
jgi:hypothetical protein